MIYRFTSPPPMPEARKWYCPTCRSVLKVGVASYGLVPSDEEMVRAKQGERRGRRRGEDLQWGMKYR